MLKKHDYFLLIILDALKAEGMINGSTLIFLAINWCHLNAELNNSDEISIVKNSVDGFGVPVPHFGVILEMDQWQKLANRLKTKNFLFIIEPYIRFKGQSGEQATMFFSDPSGNAIEIKAFRNIDAQLFAK